LALLESGKAVFFFHFPFIISHFVILNGLRLASMKEVCESVVRKRFIWQAINVK